MRGRRRQQDCKVTSAAGGSVRTSYFCFSCLSRNTKGAVGAFHLLPPVVERKQLPLTATMSTAPPLIASKTHGIEKSVW
nr:uncharacterized protein LOC113806316 isoform X4 [Penaeus vannamei]